MAAPSPTGIFGPPVKKIPPGGPSTNAAFNAVLARYPGLKDYRDSILQAAADERISPAQLAAVLAIEGGWGASGQKPNPKGALGLAQIVDTQARPQNTSGEPFFRPGNLNISDADKLDPTFAIKYMAWRIGGDLKAGYTLSEVYGGASPYAYNPGFNAQYGVRAGPQGILDKAAPNYVPPARPSPAASAASEVATRTATRGFNDPFVTANGKPFVGDTPPPDALPSQRFYGQAMRQSEYQALAGKIRNDPYVDAQGKPLPVVGLEAPSNARPSELFPGQSMRLSEYKHILTDFRSNPWVTKTGKFVVSETPPADVLQSQLFAAQPMRKAEYVQLLERSRSDPFITSSGKEVIGIAPPPDARPSLALPGESMRRSEYKQLLAKSRTDPYVDAQGKVIATAGFEAPPTARPSEIYPGQSMRLSEYKQLLAKERADPYVTASGQPIYSEGPPPGAQPSQFYQGQAMRLSEYKQLLSKSRTDPYVTSTGAVVKSAGPPANAIPSSLVIGDAMRISEFNTFGRRYNEFYSAFVGRRATQQEIAHLIQSQVSDFELKRRLSKAPGFSGSPIWQARSGDYVSAARQVMGPSYTPPKSMIAKAIALDQGQDAFAESLRQTPEYERSPVFQDAKAKLANQFQQIYGTPGPNAKSIIEAHAKAGWSPDQFAGWLRAQPAYTTSTEYQTSQLDIATQLGLITGRVPSLVRGPQPPNPNADYPTTQYPPASGGTPPYPYTGPGPDSQPQPRNPYVIGAVNA